MKLKLSTKAVFIIAVMIVIGMATCIAALVYAWRMRQALDDSISINAMEMLAAAELDIALVKQRDFMTSHMLDAENQKWMDELDNLKPLFRAGLERFKKSAVELEEKALLAETEEAFTRYDVLRNKIKVFMSETADIRSDLEKTNLILSIPNVWLLSAIP